MAGNEIKGEMIRGHVDTFILLSLVDGDKDSNDIKSAIEERSENKFTVKQGTFYSAMQRLVKQNYIKEYRSSAADGIRRKYYSLTEKGKKSLDKSRDEWNKSKELIDNIIDTAEQEPEKPKNIVTKIEFDEFDEFKKLADENAKDYSFEAPDSSAEDYLDRLGEEVLSDLNDELNAINAKDDQDNRESDTDASERDGLTDGVSIYDEILPPNDDELLTDASDEIVPSNEISDVSEEIENKIENIDEYSPNNDSSDNVETATDESEIQSESVDNVEYIDNTYIENTDEYSEMTDDNSITYEFELPQDDEDIDKSNGEVSEIKSENIVKSSEISEENCSVSENDGRSVAYEESSDYSNRDGEIEQPKNDAAKKSETLRQKEKDDSLYVEDGEPTNRREYKTILGKLFPKGEKEEKTDLHENDKQNVVDAKQIDIDEYASSDKDYEEKNADSSIDDSSGYDRYKKQFGSDNYEQNETIANEKNTTANNEKIDKEAVQSAEYDFSDLYKMAKNEGFKVRTSLSTNKFNGSGIFLNKLNFHASLLTYFLLFVEMLILNLSLSSVLKWSFTVKAIIAGVPALLPLVTLILYLIAPKRKVREISQFRDAITVFLIITFQLIIINLCVALFMEVDFNNVKEVLTYIVVPFILIINVPLFAIVKYTLLDTGKYFDEIKE